MHSPKMSKYFYESAGERLARRFTYDEPLPRERENQSTPSPSRRPFLVCFEHRTLKQAWSYRFKKA